MNYSIRHSVVSFEITAPHTIRIYFEDGVTQTIAFNNVLGGELLRPLRDPDFFHQVFVSDGIPTLTWPNGADFNPDHLHDWQSYEPLYIERADRWEKHEETQGALVLS
jgi:hypothetical protein